MNLKAVGSKRTPRSATRQRYSGREDTVSGKEISALGKYFNILKNSEKFSRQFNGLYLPTQECGKEFA